MDRCPVGLVARSCFRYHTTVIKDESLTMNWLHSRIRLNVVIESWRHVHDTELVYFGLGSQMPLEFNNSLTTTQLD